MENSVLRRLQQYAAATGHTVTVSVNSEGVWWMTVNFLHTTPPEGSGVIRLADPDNAAGVLSERERERLTKSIAEYDDDTRKMKTALADLSGIG